MTMVSIPNNWTPRPYQLPVLQYFDRGGKRAVLKWHRRGGKDEVALNICAREIIKTPANYWYMLPQAEQARKVLWDRVDKQTGQKIIDRVFPHEIRKRTNDTNMKIQFVNGSTFQLCGSDNYNGLVGADVRGLVFSEYALADPAAWGYLSPILEENGGWALFISTLRGKNHFTDLYDFAAANPDWFVSSVNALQSGVFTQDQLENIKRELTGLWGVDQGTVLFEQEYMNNDQVFVLGSIYGREIMDAREEGRVCPVPHNAAYPVYTFWDLGVDDCTSIVFTQFYGGKIHVIDYYENHNVGMAHYVAVLRGKAQKLGYQYETLTIPHDGDNTEWESGKTRRDALCAQGFKVRVLPRDKVIDGINAARMVFGLCRFDAQNARRLLDCLTNYRRKWDESKKQYGKEPLHNWASHGCDAFRYMAMAYKFKLEHPLTAPADLQKSLIRQETFDEMMKRRRRRRQSYDY